MSNNYDTIIIGAGHNGLVAAARLARAGRQVLLLEAREVLGGAAATEAVWPGYRVNVGAPNANLLADEVVQGLFLKMNGLQFVEPEVALFAPGIDGRSLTLYGDDEKNVTEIGRFSARDAAGYPAFAAQVRQLSGVLRAMMGQTPPDIARLNLGELSGWGKLGLDVKRLGDRAMMELLRVLPMGFADYVNEWFETDALKGLLGGDAIIGTRQGPRSGGTTLTFLYQQSGGFLQNRFVVGGMGRLAQALAAVARHSGAEIRTGAPVARILVDNHRAVGVALAAGEVIRANAIASSADPQRTLLGLVGPQQLQPRFMHQVRNIMMRGSTAQVILALTGLPEFVGQTSEAQLHGHIRIAPTLDYLEKAYDASKYGRISAQPYLNATIPTLHDRTLAPGGYHLMTITMQYAPYALHDGDWDDERERLGDLVVATMAQYAPNLPSQIANRHTITPLDWERDYGLTEGSIFHGQMGLGQLLVMRPVPGWGRYRTPIEGLYLCGAGAHPGGGVTGLPGWLAAKEILNGR